MSLVIQNLGYGAAYLLYDEITQATLLLGCGEIRTTALSESTNIIYHDTINYTFNDIDNDKDTKSLSSSTYQLLQSLKGVMERNGENRLDAILIADYRSDSCFHLPYLTEKCTSQDGSSGRPPIYMTHATRALAPLYLCEYWNSLYGQKSKATLTPPYSLLDISTCFYQSTPISLKGCIVVNKRKKLCITAYHAGTVPGSCFFNIEMGATSFIYAPNINLRDGHQFKGAEVPRLCSHAVLTKATSGSSISGPHSSIERDLMKVVYECLQSKGVVVIPIHLSGIGCFQEILAIFESYLGNVVTMYLALDDINADTEYLSRFDPVLKNTFSTSFKGFGSNLKKKQSLLSPFDWKLLKSSGSYILFTGSANILTGNSFRAIQGIASDPKNLIVLSDNCTIGRSKVTHFANSHKTQMSKKLGFSLACGIHYFSSYDCNHAASTLPFLEQVGPISYVLLDTPVASESSNIIASLRKQLQNQSALTFQSISESSIIVVDSTKTIHLRLHKRLFNEPSKIDNALIISEEKSKNGATDPSLIVLTEESGLRRLKRKKHSLEYFKTWKKPKSTPRSNNNNTILTQGLKRSRSNKNQKSKSSSALSFLLSAAVGSDDEEEDTMSVNEEPQCNNPVRLTNLIMERTNHWIPDERGVIGNKKDFVIRSISLYATSDWGIEMTWNFEDEELAARVFGIATDVVIEEFAVQEDAEEN